MKKKLKILVTAGPTREFFDPVRFLSNPSSGKMGYALAEAALKKGHQVTLISGPTFLSPPSSSIRLIRVTSADEMYRAVIKSAPRSDMVIMTAAVSDYRPVRFSPKKMKKTGKNLMLTFVPTKDILKELGCRKKRGQILVGFAAESDHLIENALKKLHRKNLDFIVANQIGSKTSGFESDFNQAVILSASGLKKSLRRMSKSKMAEEIVDYILSKVLSNPRC